MRFSVCVFVCILSFYVIMKKCCRFHWTFDDKSHKQHIKTINKIIKTHLPYPKSKIFYKSKHVLCGYYKKKRKEKKVNKLNSL